MTKGSEERNLMEFFFGGVRSARERDYMLYIWGRPLIVVKVCIVCMHASMEPLWIVGQVSPRHGSEPPFN